MWWRIPICVVGGLIAVYALFVAYLLAFHFRMDTSGELPETLEADLWHGGVFAVGLFLFGFPPRRSDNGSLVRPAVAGLPPRLGSHVRRVDGGS